MLTVQQRDTYLTNLNNFGIDADKMKINKKLIPIKGHYFLFNAGTAPLVPYLSTYAKQLGFSSATVGLIYTVLPIFGLIVKPLFGIIADRFKIQKPIFILFQIVTIVSFSSIYFIPENASKLTVEMDCGDGATMLRRCYQSANQIDKSKINTLGNLTVNDTCKMNCNMSSPKMWQTVCEHWHIPQYCYSTTNYIKYTSHINSVSVGRDSCIYIATDNVTLDGYTFKPSCRIGNGYVDINALCHLNCTNSMITTMMMNVFRATMTCANKMLNYKLCQYRNIDMGNIKLDNDYCQASCNLNKSTPWQLMEICEGWKADIAKTCQVKSSSGHTLPQNLSFIGSVKLSSAIVEHKCVYMKLKQIELPDGSIHYPNCISKTDYQTKMELFHTSCETDCTNSLANELFLTAQNSKKDSKKDTQYTSQFWLFFALMIVSWIGQAVVVTFADAICFNLLGREVSLYGRQRLWGSVGWGIFSLLTGSLIDLFSDGAYKDYTVAFILMFVFMCGDVIVSCFLKNESTKLSINILSDVSTLFTSLPTFVFMLWTVSVGLCTGLLWNFLFWHLEDISQMTSTGSDYIKTLQGLVSAIQTFCGEIPFMFLSGYILRKIGHTNMMSLVLFAFGVRFTLYANLTNPWWTLPIEMLQGITFGMFYPTMTSYANVVSPCGTETTVQGLVGAIFEGVGTSLGSFIGGRLYETYGGRHTFLWFGIGAFIMSIFHAVVYYVLKNRNIHSAAGLQPGYTSIMRQEQIPDTVFMLDDLADLN